MTIELGWWILPAIITVVAFLAAVAKAPDSKPSGYIPDMWSPMIGIFLYLMAAVVSLVCWLVWALLS